MATQQQQQRDGIGALSSRLALSRSIIDRAASNAARINGAETRASAQLDDIVATIGGRMIADAAGHTDQCASGEAGRSGSASPACSSRMCLDCKTRPADAVGRSGAGMPFVCQSCFNAARAELDASRTRTEAVLARIGASMAKTKPPVKVDGMKLVCTCGCDEFEYLKPEPAEPEINVPGHRGGYECDNCGNFFEREAHDRDD